MGNSRLPIRSKVTVCLGRSLGPFYIGSYYINWVKASWTDSIT